MAIVALLHPLVLHAAPQALDEDVVSLDSASIHRQSAAGPQDHASQLLGDELAVLIGIDDLERAMTRYRLLADLRRMARL